MTPLRISGVVQDANVSATPGPVDSNYFWWGYAGDSPHAMSRRPLWLAGTAEGGQMA